MLLISSELAEMSEREFRSLLSKMISVLKED
jgi:flagellar biosynthesis regulator FlbT